MPNFMFSEVLLALLITIVVVPAWRRYILKSMLRAKMHMLKVDANRGDGEADMNAVGGDTYSLLRELSMHIEDNDPREDKVKTIPGPKREEPGIAGFDSSGVPLVTTALEEQELQE